MKVSINKPCHENWDEMLPNEKGAFCLACQKTVVDFSTKTTNEIKSFFRSITETEKVCGRFKEEQLTELTFDDFFSRFRKWILPHKLAVILFFIFGLSLFSCQTTKQEPLMGAVAYNDQPEVTGKVSYVEETDPTDTIKVRKQPEQVEIVKMGEVMAQPVLTQTTTPKPHKQPKDVPTYLKGDIAFEPDTIKKTNCVKKDTLPEKHKMGKIKIGD